MSVDQAVAFFLDDARRHKSCPIVDAERNVVGMVSRADVLGWHNEPAHDGATLYDMGSDADLAVVHAGDLLGQAVDLMVERDVGRIPVVAPHSRRLVGLVARKDILRIRAVRNAQENDRAAFFGPAVGRQTEAQAD